MKGNRKKEEAGSSGRKKRVFLRYVLILIGSLILGINVYLWNGRNLTGNTMPMPFGYGMAVVLSGSMEPVLDVNDLVFVQEQETYQVGDIIVYQSGDELIIHRIVERYGDMLLTQGDANNGADPPIDISSVKGKMVGSIPGIGSLVRALKTPAGIIIVLAAAVVLMEFSYRREWAEENMKQQKMKEEIRRLKEQQNKTDEGIK